jgi:hypothetical protein
MARMIPPQYDPSTVSAGEKRVFHLLETDPRTGEWIVLHSLGLSRRREGPYGEIDFVVLVPSGGVVCLEVKGGRVSCKNGVWETVDRLGARCELSRSPFMQAREGMFALLRAVKTRFGVGSEPSRCLFAYAVVFPDVDCPPQTPEFELHEAIDRNALSSPISKAVLKVLALQRTKIGFKGSTGTHSAIGDIRQFLRPDFERVVARSTVVGQCESSLISLTEDQYTVLDMISDNPRCLIEGAAGTGKTVLALEYSRRQVAKGNKVLLLCFNRLLGDWFQQSTISSKTDAFRACSYHRFVRELVMASLWKEEFEAASREQSTEKVFSELMPFYSLLAVEGLGAHFDVLVLDEAQDLLNAGAVEFLGTLLKGGMAGGRWYLFGDFTRQCIYGGPSREVRMEALASSCANFAHTNLRTNCRNTRRIGEETALLSGFSSPPYKLGQVDGLPVDYRYWKNSSQQLEKLTAVVRDLLTEGMKPADLVLLSTKRFCDSVASKLSLETERYGTITVEEVRSGIAPSANKTKLAFATVHSFKGMETPAAIFCDIDRVEDDEPQALLYIGMSRARSLLVLLVRESVRQAIGNCVARKLTEGWEL